MVGNVNIVVSETLQHLLSVLSVKLADLVMPHAAVKTLPRYQNCHLVTEIYCILVTTLLIKYTNFVSRFTELYCWKKYVSSMAVLYYL